MQQLFVFGANSDLVAALSDCGVRFLVIGGLAVKLYVPSREVDDLDLLVEQTAENAKCLFQAFARLGIRAEFPQELIAVPGERPQQISLQTIQYADIVTRPDIDFPIEWQQATEARIGQTVVRFASRALLRRLKGNSDREKDLTDVALLGYA